MIGQIGLLVRVALYVAAGWLGSQGWADFNAGSGTLTVDLAEASDAIAAGLLLVSTFLSSRLVKRKGGTT